MRQLFVLVPSMSPEGPVKGAIALANALVNERKVTLVSVKSGPGAQAVLDHRVRHLDLHAAGKWYKGVRRLRQVLEEAGGRGGSSAGGATMISFCLSADAMALLVRKSAHWISSVRGNLPRNYHFDYGLTGLLLAKLHLMTLGLADKVVAMTEPMAEQVGCYINRRPAIIGNFVDEAVLEPYRRPAGRNKPLHFVFLGSLSARKQPLELIAAAHQLINSGKTIQVTLVGEGVLRADIEAAIRSANLKDNIQLTGQLDDPYLILAQADALVLPSMSEGVSRAVLEALHLGIPAVLRDVDGNREVIEPGINGTLFSDPAQLSRCMLEAADLRRSITSQQSLLPSRFRQKACASSYLDLAEAL